jgi:transcriptional regulator with XRE-family HTH domain
MDLGDKIRHFRVSKGYSQEYLAEMLNISRNTYMNIESGNTNTAYQKIDKIAEVLGVNKWEILTYAEKVVQFVEKQNVGYIAKNENIIQQNADQDLREKYKSLEIKIAVLEERLSNKDAEIAQLNKLIEALKK